MLALVTLALWECQPALDEDYPYPLPSRAVFPLPYARSGIRLAGPWRPLVFVCEIDPVLDVVTNWYQHPSYLTLDPTETFRTQPGVPEIGILCGPSLPSAYATVSARFRSEGIAVPLYSRYQPYTTVFQRVLWTYDTALQARHLQRQFLLEHPERRHQPLVPLEYAPRQRA